MSGAASLRLYRWDWVSGNPPWVSCDEPAMQVVNDWFEKGTAARNWTHPILRQIKVGRKKLRPEALVGYDQPVPQFSDVRVVSDRALAVVRPFLEGVAEVLPFAPHEAGQFWAVRFTRVIDAFDEEHAEFDRYPSSGRVMHVFRWAFKPDLLPRDDRVFRIPLRYWPIVTQPFVDAVQAAKLTGFRFHLLWDESLKVQPDQRNNTWAQ